MTNEEMIRINSGVGAGLDRAALVYNSEDAQFIRDKLARIGAKGVAALIRLAEAKTPAESQS